MIAFLIGVVEEIEDGCIYLNVNGVGYKIKTTPDICSQLSNNKDHIKIYTSMQVREDSVTLFGFLKKADIELFELVLGVNGIGPKGALAILSTMTSDMFRTAIACQDAKAISKAPGIGAKTAQRIILDLKDKIKLEDNFGLEDSVSQDSSFHITANEQTNPKTEAIQALVALGYSNVEATMAVKKAAKPDMDTEAILKQALKHLSFL